MSEIRLTGLRANSPIGAMAAFGCFRSSAQRGAARLRWEPKGGSFSAVLDAGDCNKEGLLEHLIEDARRAPERFELTWRKKLKALPVNEYREASRSALRYAVGGNRDSADWFAAFGNEIAVDKEGSVAITPLDMTGGPQEWLTGALAMAAALGQVDSAGKGRSAREYFEEALFGPWRYSDDQHSLGWDPATIKLGAFTYKAPTKMANAGVLAAVWLAFQSIPLFPCFAVKGRLEMRSFERRQRVFSWPIWTAPITLDELQFLLALDYESPENLSGRGVTAVYQTKRFFLNKYYASFQPPELVFGGVQSAASAFA